MTENQAMLWVEALRSGKYKQTSGHLKDKRGYCCLGVLCEISGKVSFNKLFNIFGNYSIGSEKMTTVLPIEVRNEFGLYDYEGGIPNKCIEIDGIEYECLAEANDKGVPFNKLADWIEENYMYL